MRAHTNLIIKAFALICACAILSSCIVFEELRIAQVNNNACFYMPSIDAQKHNLHITVTSNEIGTNTPYQTNWDASINAVVANSLESCISYSGKPFDDKRIYDVLVEANAISDSSVVSHMRSKEGFCVKKTNDGKPPIFLLKHDYQTCSIFSYNENGTKPFFIVHSGKLILFGFGVFVVVVIRFFRRRKYRRIKNDR